MKVSFIWLNVYCYYYNSCSNCSVFAHRDAGSHSSIALSITLWSITCHAYSKWCLIVWTTINVGLKLASSKFAHGFILITVEINWFMWHFSFAFSFRFATNLNFLIPKGSAATLLRCGRKQYVNFVGNFFLFPAVKQFCKSVKIWRFYHGELGDTLFGTRCK